MIRYLLLEVSPGLLNRNERHANSHVHDVYVPREGGIASQRGTVAGGLVRSHRAVLCRPKRDEWRIEARDEIPAEALGTVRPDDKSCRSGFEPVISRAAGSIVMVPDGYVTLDGSDEPITDARVASRST